MTNLGFPAVDQCQIRQTASAPLIGLPSDRRMVGVHPFHCVGEKYICAAVVGAEALPVLLPSLQPALDWAQMLDRLDGLILTGRSEEHTSELQSIMRISYAVFCLEKKKTTTRHPSVTV